MNTTNYIDVPFNGTTLDIYIVRKSILEALNETLPVFSGKLLDVGCGRMPYRDYIIQHSAVHEYIGVDIESVEYQDKIKPDFYWDGETLPFKNESFDCVFSTEVLEHVPDTWSFLKEIFRVLKSNGIFFFTTPFLWPLHDTPHDEYRLTPFSLQRISHKVGFSHIEIKPLGGWHASLAQMLGLWVRRAPLSKQKRSFLTFIIKPIIHYLINQDKSTHKSFNRGLMMTGLYGTFKK